MTDLIEKLRPHPCVSDDASVMYRAKDIRALFDALAAQAAEIERLTKDISGLMEEIDDLFLDIVRLKAAIFGAPGFDPALRIGNFVEMAHATEAARQGAIARADALSARVAELEAALGEAREEILDLAHARWSEVEATDDEMVSFIDTALKGAEA